VCRLVYCVSIFSYIDLHLLLTSGFCRRYAYPCQKIKDFKIWLLRLALLTLRRDYKSHIEVRNVSKIFFNVSATDKKCLTQLKNSVMCRHGLLRIVRKFDSEGLVNTWLVQSMTEISIA